MSEHEGVPTEHRLRCQLRWRDMDMLGHMNQSVYHEVLEEGRAALMESLVARSGHGLDKTYVVVRIELDYRAEVRKDHGEVEVIVRTGDVGTSSFVVEHDILRPDGTLAATGRTILVGWDARARTKRTLTDRERAALGAERAEP